MGKLAVFNNISLDGFFVDAKGDMNWAKVDNDDPEFATFVAQNSKGDSTLVFGRVTYEMMASFWPTPMAAQMMPVVAERMNTASKVVFSRTLSTAPWQNTRLVNGNPAAEIRRLKESSDVSLTVLGSGNIVAQLTEAGLVDEYQFVINPVILGAGRTQFDGVTQRPVLHLERSRIFRNGRVFLAYSRT